MRLSLDSGVLRCARRADASLPASSRCGRPRSATGSATATCGRSGSSAAAGPMGMGRTAGSAARRGHGVGHRRRGRSDRRGRRVLRGHPRVHGAVRSGAGLGVDGGPRRVVRSPADLVPFRGQCLVTVQLQQAAGDWPAPWRRPRTHAAPHGPAASGARARPVPGGRACRLLGAATADAAYRDASRLGYHPMPGVALLELARGDAAASASFDGRCRRPGRRRERPALPSRGRGHLLRLRGCRAARAAAEELATTACVDLAGARAMAAHATGTVLIIEGDPAAALHPLARPPPWRRPADALRGGAHERGVGLACAALGDRTAPSLEFDTPGGVPRPRRRADVDRLDSLAGDRRPPTGCPNASVRFSATRRRRRRTGRSPRRSGSARTRSAGMWRTSSPSSV